MKVKVIHRPLRQYPVGHELEIANLLGRKLIHAKRVELVEQSTPQYQTRMMQAAPLSDLVHRGPVPQTSFNPEAPYGYKADGTPRLRPGRAPKAEN